MPAALAVDSRNIEREPARIRTRKKRTAGFAADTANSFGPEETVAVAAATEDKAGLGAHPAGKDTREQAMDKRFEKMLGSLLSPGAKS